MARSGCGTVGRSPRGKVRAAVLVLVHLAIVAHVAHWKISGRSLTPLEPSEAGETLTLGYVNAGFLLLAAAVVATLVAGRFFCGWACHVVAYQDLCAWILRKLGLRPKPIRSRLLVLVPALAALLMFVVPVVLRLLEGHGVPTPRWHLSTDDLWARFPGPGIAALTIAVDGFLLVWLLGSKGFCTYGCPYGAIFGAAGRLAPARIRVTDACESCGHCTATCTSNVRVHEEVARYRMVVDPGCMRCMDCVSVCPKGALHLGFGPLPRAARRAEKAAGRRRMRRSYDFTWPEEIAMALVFLGSLYAFRGLYGAVPFLLAIGLSVLAALAAVLAWRLVRRRALSFQHVVLEREGGLTRAGWFAAFAAPLYLAFALHSGIVQRETREGERRLEAAGDLARGSAERAEAVRTSREHLERALGLSLFPTTRLRNQLGQLAAEAGDDEGAVRHLRAALADDPDLVSARVVLAGVLRRRGEHAEAELLLAEARALRRAADGGGDPAGR